MEGCDESVKITESLVLVGMLFEDASRDSLGEYNKVHECCFLNAQPSDLVVVLLLVLEFLTVKVLMTAWLVECLQTKLT